MTKRSFHILSVFESIEFNAYVLHVSKVYELYKDGPKKEIIVL